MSHRNIFYYDSRDNLTCVRDPDLGLTYYTYDAGSRMTSVKNPFGEVTYYDYRPDGQVSRKTLGNGCVTYYEFDSIGRTTKVDNRKGDMSVISSFAYERDAVGNPLSIAREDGYTVYYDYDAKHQLTGERHLDGGEVYAWEWDYDAAGNREYQVFNGEATYYEYNAANELLTETTGGETTYYDYDACGNTTVKQEPSGVTYYHWNQENLMTRLDLPDGGHCYFAYDADSKRVSRRDSDGFTEFIYQGPDMLKLQLERDEAGETRVRYTMGAGLEAMRRASNGIASGDSSFYHFDWLGSTFELTDESQVVTDEYLYNAWGEVLERTGTTENPHQWVGRERYYRRHYEASYLAGHRECIAKYGRFLSSVPGSRAGRIDPSYLRLWLRAGAGPIYLEEHPYAYADAVPTSHVDPLGLWGQDVHEDDTRIIASATRVSVGSARRGFNSGHAARIGSCDINVDFSTLPGSSWHFDHPITRPYGTRMDRFQQMWVAAMYWDSLSQCQRAYCALGRALHPLQDIDAHGPATPCEHMDYRNKPWMDARGQDTNWSYVMSTWRGPSYMRSLCGGLTVRIFRHGGGMGRLMSTIASTRQALQAYLRTAKCCFDVFP